VLIQYHGRNETHADIGDYVQYQTVDGHFHEGILLKVEHPAFPHNLTYLSLLEGGGMKRINTNLIFRFERMTGRGVA
jgi:hypothetical protein